MGVVSRIASFLTPAYSTRPGLSGVQTWWEQAEPSALYDLLRAYYHSNDLYSDVQRALYNRGEWKEAMRPLRNPANRTVEFHVAKLWGGPLDDALPLEAKNAAILEPIRQVWTWSNWAAQKQVAARHLAMLGDLFLKVTQNADGNRVYFQVIDPGQVADFDTDERGYLTYIRVDVPQSARDGDKVKAMTRTEVWTKETYRVWMHDKKAGEEIARLGTPTEQHDTAEFGIDFVPFVHAKFRDVGNDRGMAAIMPALDKIDEANRQATRLHQMLFRNNTVTWALRANGNTADGRPLPPPSFGNDASTSGDTTTVTLGDDRMLRLPGTTTIESLVPNINYAAALSVLNAQMDEIEKDLPELAYYKLREMGQISGIAVRLLLSDAIDRVIEARGNAYAALIRADQMALTIGVQAGLFPSSIGTFQAGDFDHGFADVPVIPLSPTDEATADEARARTAQLLADRVSDAEFLRIARPDWDEAQIQKVTAEREQQGPSAFAMVTPFLGQGGAQGA